MKKSISIILIIAMLFVTASCGNNVENIESAVDVNSETVDEENIVDENATEGNTVVENMYKMENGKVVETWGVKLVEEPTTIKIFARQDSDAVVNENDNFWKQMEEMTGVTAVGTANSKLDSVSDLNYHAYEGLNSDIVSVAHLTDEIMVLASQDQFYDLNEYLDYMPNLSAFLETEQGKQVYEMSLSEGGEFFLVPSIERFHETHVPMIRQDWLDKLGLPVPQTTEELYETLKAFKDNDLGDRVTIPFVAKGWVLKQNSPVLWGARTETRATGRMVNDIDGNFYHGWSTPEFRNMLTEVSKWYDEGLIAENVFSVDDPLEDHLPTDQGGFIYWSTSKLSYNDKEDMPEGFELVRMFPTEFEGQRYDQRSTHMLRKGRIGISKSCDNPELAAMYLDALLSEEGTISQTTGFVGDQIKFVDVSEDGYNVYQYSQEWSEEMNSEKYADHKDARIQSGILGMGLTMDAYDNVRIYGSEETEFALPETTSNDEYTFVDAINDGTILFIPAKTMTFSSEDTQRINEIKAKLETYQDKVFEEAITGNYMLLDDIWWEAYITECNNLGMQELVNIYNQ